jgi:hypothetical protein
VVFCGLGDFSSNVDLGILACHALENGCGLANVAGLNLELFAARSRSFPKNRLRHFEAAARLHHKFLAGRGFNRLRRGIAALSNDAEEVAQKISLLGKHRVPGLPSPVIAADADEPAHPEAPPNRVLNYMLFGIVAVVDRTVTTDAMVCGSHRPLTPVTILHRGHAVESEAEKG